MRIKRKFLVILCLVIILIIPTFLGKFTDYLLVEEIEFANIFYLTLGFIVLLFLGILISNFVYDNESLELMKNHDVINSLINNNNKIILYLFFPLTMIMEELIFRYYTIGILSIELDLETVPTVLISSIVFSVYHIHFWFRFKNLRITTTYVVYSFLLGLFTAYILIHFNIFVSIAAHYMLAFAIYYTLFKKKYKNKI